MTTSRAWRIHEFGGLDRLCLEQIEIAAGQGELLVRVEAVAINPVDLKTVNGKYPMITVNDLPYTLGRDLAGTIVGVTEEGTGFSVGERIFAFVGQGQGTFADYARVPVEAVARRPGSLLDATRAVAVPLAALTAWQGLFEHGHLAADQRVLIHGAGGGLGLFAVQLARNAGAHVVATATGEVMQRVAEMGAEQVIDYKATRFEQACGEVDLVLDLVGGETQDRSWSVLKRGGRLISTLSEPSREKAEQAGATGARFTCRADGSQLADIGAMVDAGTLEVRVVETFDFDHLRDALARQSEGHVSGKLVVNGF